MSRFLRMQFNNKGKNTMFFVLAVKHPYDTLENLILNKSVVYLSHPISEVRRLEKINEHSLTIPLRTEMKIFAEKIIEKFATFLPTTIDEYRIKSITNKKRKLKGIRRPKAIKKPEIYYTNSLSERWDEDIYLYPHNIFFDQIKSTTTNILWSKTSNENIDFGISTLLQALRSRISNQVSVRDYILVEQSDILIIFKPVFNGNISGGVEEEYDYFNSLHALNLFKGMGREKIYVYCPKNDIIKLIENIFSKQLDICINDTKVFACNHPIPKLNAQSCDRIFESIMKVKNISDIDAEPFLTIFTETLFKQFDIKLIPETISKIFSLYKLPSPEHSEIGPLAGSEDRINRLIIDTVFVKQFLDGVKKLYLYKNLRFIMPENSDLENINKFIDDIK